MYTQKIKLSLGTLTEEDALEKMYHLLSVLRANGQIIGKEWPLFKKNNSIIAIVMSLEKNSLDESNLCIYSRKIKKQLHHAISIKQVGDKIELEHNLCSCTKSSFFILYTHYLKIGSPLNCGDCFGEIPLYKLKNEEGYSDILSWESNYIACDTLQMNCTIGEKFGLKQLSNMDSPLSKEGIELAKKIKRTASIPTFYYLYNYKKITLKKDKNRKCPSCNKPWLLNKKLHDKFDFKCDKCNLISNLTFNSL